MKLCKICKHEISKNRIYCSNKCKFSDTDYNKSRIRITSKKQYKFKCTECEWGTNDAKNSSGSIVKHYIQKHNWTHDQVYSSFNILPSVRFKRKQLLSKEADIQCKLCGEKFRKISNTHLLNKHNITTKQYKDMFPQEDILGIKTKNKQSKLALESQWNEIINGDRLPSTIIPKFKKHEYIGVSNRTQYKFECKTCELVFTDNLDDGNIPSCKNCNPPKQFSPSGKAQTELIEYIKTIYDGHILTNDRKIISPMELDIVIPNLKIAIEFHGLYWHGEDIVGKNYHVNKLKKAVDADYRLIQIFEDEWMSKKEIVKSKLLHLLNKNRENVVYARNTELKIMRDDKGNRLPIVTEFLNKYHLQGDDRRNKAYGLYYAGQLVAVATFSAARIATGHTQKKDGEFELSRLAFKSSTLVVGGASKLIKAFINDTPDIKKIYSYADMRYVDINNNVYKSCGFELVGTTSPGYWYFKRGNPKKRFHRFNFTKASIIKKFNITDTDKSEYELMKSLKYDRIWDCGNLKYELTIK